MITRFNIYMVDSNYYVENPANSSMHYGNKPIVGVIDFPNKLPVNRPYNYFEGEAMYNRLMHDIFQQQQYADPGKVKKGVPKIIKYTVGALIAAFLAFMGVKGVKKLIAKFKH